MESSRCRCGYNTAKHNMLKIVSVLHDVLAKYNASIRVKYPPSAPVARVMEHNTSGWVNDAPFVIQEFKHAAEDAIYATQAVDYSLGEGVNEVLDAAQEWAGHTPIDDRGRQVWHKKVSIIERGLFDLVRKRSKIYACSGKKKVCIQQKENVPIIYKIEYRML